MNHGHLWKIAELGNRVYEKEKGRGTRRNAK